jgi:ppGpp synthetase/RelA/SpoT-type nucleotidyltranferase
MAWVEPRYEPSRVNAAGRALVAAMHSDFHSWSDQELQKYLSEVEVINNWRSSHGYPLNTFQVNLRATARRYDQSPLVAQRVKRLSSIGHKLDRFPTMKLSQMQDLGGCRAILANVGIVREVHSYYRHESAIKHEQISTDDYLELPKVSGYRGVHLIYRYFSDKNKSAYNGLKIEMQLRSRYQHAWATAVETVGTFSGEALKSSLGSEQWQRFFALMASAIALRERSNLVPGTPVKRAQLAAELSEYATVLNVEHRLREYGHALSSITNASARTADARFYLLELDPGSGTLKITGFGVNEREMAEKRYSDAEVDLQQKPGMDAVLVSVESVNSLSKAYPNYFADTRLFLELLSQAISGKSRGIVVPDRQLEMVLK